MGSIKKAFDLTGKNALVTGGSRGLGLQIAEALGEQGARVVISSRKAPELEKAQAHLAGLGIKAEWIAADNSRDEDVKRLTDEAIKKLGRVDILVNNAGATWGAPTEDHPIEAWDKVMNLNIRSLFLLSQQIAKHSMIPNKYGRIINLASIAGLFGSSGDMQMIAYNTSKGAVVNFTRGLAGSWGRYGITANALAPGFFPSRMTKGTIEAVGVEKLAAGAPLRRIGDEDDLKGAELVSRPHRALRKLGIVILGLMLNGVHLVPHRASRAAGPLAEANPDASHPSNEFSTSMPLPQRTQHLPPVFVSEGAADQIPPLNKPRSWRIRYETSIKLRTFP